MKPLVPAEVDLSDFKFMPLDCVRLRDSDLASKVTGDEFRCAVLLWCASWHQQPAASLPDDDEVLAKLAGFGRVVKEWKKVKDGAMRGWVACDDGRLYHPVVAEKALEAWRSKLMQRWKTECARIKKHADRHEIKLPRPEFDDWMAAGCPQGQALPVPRDVKPVSQGQSGSVPREPAFKGQGRDRDISPPSSEKEKPARAPALARPPDVAEATWRDWLALRKAKRAPASETVLREARSEAEKAGMSLERFLAVWCARGSQGLEAGWLKPHERGGPPSVEPFRTAKQRDADDQAARVYEMTGGLMGRPSQARQIETIDMENIDAVPRLGSC